MTRACFRYLDLYSTSTCNNLSRGRILSLLSCKECDSKDSSTGDQTNGNTDWNGIGAQNFVGLNGDNSLLFLLLVFGNLWLKTVLNEARVELHNTIQDLVLVGVQVSRFLHDDPFDNLRARWRGQGAVVGVETSGVLGVVNEADDREDIIEVELVISFWNVRALHRTSEHCAALSGLRGS